MRIQHVHISDYKNLKDFTLSFDNDSFLDDGQRNYRSAQRVHIVRSFTQILTPEPPASSSSAS